MADTTPYRYFGIQILLTSNFNVKLIASFRNAFASLLALFNKTETTTLLVGCSYGFKSITSWFTHFASTISHLCYSLVSFKEHYICHVKMHNATNISQQVDTHTYYL